MRYAYKTIMMLFVISFIIGCSEEQTTNPPINKPAKSTTFYDLPADAGITPKIFADLPADTGKTGKFTFFSFKDTSIVRWEDSNSTKWDIAFQATNIIVNCGVRGPGQGGAIVLGNTSFNDVTLAPETGYKTEDELTSLAIPVGSDNGWYHYDGAKMTITPIPGVVIVIRTADGKYAKLQILSYYKGTPEVIDTGSTSRYYTFRYVYQPDGSRNLTNRTGKFTLFRFSDSSIVSSADSNSTKWDIGFQSTNIIINCGVRGPGQGGAIVLRDTSFNDVLTAPETGYKIETDLKSYVIPAGSDNGWYHYDGAKMTITPIPGVVIVVRTADGKYAKLQILSYYKGNPEVIDPNMPARYYTFRYVYQPDGSKNLDVK